MNFYGDSFHVNQNKPDEDKQDLPTYDWKYDDTPADSLVVKAIRKNSKTGKVYRPQRAILTGFKTLYEGSGSTCQFTRPKLTPPERNIWPKDCTDINGEAIKNSLSNGTIGFMHLNGKRLGNLGPIEALPETFIRDIQKQQQSDFKGNKFAGSFQLSPGARGGKVSTLRRCENENDCYIARFGWIGDRVSLEDQVANAARTEMNILTPEGFVDLYGRGAKIKNPLRYNTPVCGPADKKCQQSPGNSSLSEENISVMADYGRWIGIPNRSEFQVTREEVIQGEKVFRNIHCNACHVIDKIPLDADDNMLSDTYRNRLRSLSPFSFISYLGTDLLMHDMGYLSQVSDNPGKVKIRDQDGIPDFANKKFIQKIRTPPLKGLRFNRFVTDAYLNVQQGKVACDFLLHDGRACDAIEAAFLHDGPAVKKIDMINALNKLTAEEIDQLRAFLYSL